jgi:hypothetical protein
MARTLRIEYPGAIYHVTCRLVGSWRAGDRELFVDDADRWRFLDVLGARVEALGCVYTSMSYSRIISTWSPKRRAGTARR